MRTITKKFEGISGSTETHALDLKVQENARQTWEFLATGNNVRIRLKSVFTHPTHEAELAGSGSGTTAGCNIQTIDLTTDVLTIVNFDMKLEHVRCTYDDDDVGDVTGDLWIKATAAK